MSTHLIEYFTNKTVVKYLQLFYNDIKWKIKEIIVMNVKQITQEIKEIIIQQEGNMSDEDVLHLIEDAVLGDDDYSHFSLAQIAALVHRIFYSIRKDLDILQPYLDDETVSEIMVNGIHDVFIEINGFIQRVDVHFDSTEELEEIIRRITAKVHKDINELNPIVDARLSDGSRINAVYKNIALNGPILTVRKFPRQAITMNHLIQWGTITKEAAEYLKTLVLCGYNLFISGGTSSGKTTFLNILSNYIPSHERVIVIEDSAELQIHHIDNLVRMECKNANLQGKGQVSMEQLIKTSLRMRPDRIIVGEVRGKEVLDMIQAMNTGHDGSLSTGHGNSIEGMLLRLESMFLQAANFPIEAIRTQIAEALDIIVHLGKIQGKGRRILEIAEILGVENGKIGINPIFKFSIDEGLKATGNSLYHQQKLHFHLEEAP
jgi:pilus assembly protein CpaF